MKARNLIGFAGLVVTATLVTAFAMNAIVGTPTASANDPGKHREHKAGYDADIDQSCKVDIEFSEVRRSGVCNPDASIGQYGRGRGGGYDADVEQKCKVNIEFSEVKDSNVCKPDADVKQGAPAKKHEEKPRHDDGKKHDDRKKHDDKKHPEKPRHDDRKKHDDKKHEEKPRHDDRKKHDDKKHHAKPKTTVTYTNQEKTTCTAEGFVAINQCDVGGDANSGFRRGRGNMETASSSGGDGYDGHGSKYSYRESRYGWGDFTYTNQEKTTCEAYGLIALNQCDVDGDANAGFGRGLGRGPPGGGPPGQELLGGLTGSLPLVGGLLG